MKMSEKTYYSTILNQKFIPYLLMQIKTKKSFLNLIKKTKKKIFTLNKKNKKNNYLNTFFYINYLNISIY